MKKQTIVVGIIILLIIVGLSGCNEQTDEVSIIEIKQHVNKYLNQTVTVIGEYWKTIIKDEDSNTLYIYISDTVVKPTFIDGLEYRFTGIVRYALFPGIPYYTEPSIYLEVTKIGSIWR
jgi:hypothetical protein